MAAGTGTGTAGPDKKGPELRLESWSDQLSCRLLHEMGTLMITALTEGS